MNAAHLPNSGLHKTTSPFEVTELPTPSRRDHQIGSADAFAQIVEHAVFEALKKALNVSDVTGRRLVTARQAAQYLCLSEREIYNMISNRELSGVGVTVGASCWIYGISNAGLKRTKFRLF